MTKLNFQIVSRDDTRVLVLGTLPGEESLKRGEYYGHPRNQFWRLMGSVIGRDLDSMPYSERLEALLDAGVGLGDTVAAATRIGSLDANLRHVSATDLRALLAAWPNLEALAFNGSKAGEIGRLQLGNASTGVKLIDLPSSSPANARQTFEAKLTLWEAITPYLNLRTNQAQT
jgi:TDG/mug DNA glycosylase family protein